MSVEVRVRVRVRQPAYCVAFESAPTQLAERGVPAVIISSIVSETAETWVPGLGLGLGPGSGLGLGVGLGCERRSHGCLARLLDELHLHLT